MTLRQILNLDDILLDELAKEQARKIKSKSTGKTQNSHHKLGITYGSIFKYLVQNSWIDPRKEIFKVTYYQQLVR